MNCYTLSRLWFSFAYENPGVKPVHTALYFWILERGNASGWKKIIDIQTDKSMECLGVTDWRTYKNALQFLADNNFITWIERSKNQYTCNKISIVDNPCELSESFKNAYALNAKANAEAIAEAIVEAYAEADVEAIAEALQSYINLQTFKPSNLETLKQEPPSDNGVIEILKKGAEAVGNASLSTSLKKASHTGGAAPGEESHSRRFTDAYCDFYEGRVGVRPDFTKADGVAAASLRKFLIANSREQTEEGALKALQYIFQNWDKLEPFYQDQLKLSQIKSNINNIMNQVKNGTAKKQSTNNGRPNGVKPSFTGVSAIVDFMSGQGKFS